MGGRVGGTGSEATVGRSQEGNSSSHGRELQRTSERGGWVTIQRRGGAESGKPQDREFAMSNFQSFCVGIRIPYPDAWNEIATAPFLRLLSDTCNGAGGHVQGP